MDLIDALLSKFRSNQMDATREGAVQAIDQEELQQVAGGHNVGTGSLWL